MASSGTRVAVDIGGTFTDLVYLDPENGVGASKVLSTPPRFEDGVLNAIDAAETHDVAFFAHGTTVVINALTERTGALTALVTTAGFRDVLEIGKGNRPDLFNLRYHRETPFVPRSLRFEVNERLDFRGKVLQPLDEGEVRKLAATLRSSGAQAVGICFLHAYANGAHEVRTAEILREELPDLAISVSSELSNEWREYHRMSTAVLDAYVKPITSKYLNDLAENLTARNVNKDVRHIMRSNGGLTRFDLAHKRPLDLVESGPVGGAIGAASIGRAIGEQNLITLDIGGTTAKSSLVEGGEVKLTDDYHVALTDTTAGHPIRLPVVDIVEIGAGGGSLAWVDEGGALHVGPRSAGADPGPACYGLGGTRPTLTDANLVTGRIDPSFFLGGRMSLNVDAARSAMAPLADQLGISIEDAAMGIVRVVNARMSQLLRLLSTRRGRDIRDYAVIASGGGGAIHAAEVAADLSAKRVIVPPFPGHFSAWGMLMADLRHDLVQTGVTAALETNLAEPTAVFRELEQRMSDTFAEERVDPSSIVFARFADMRYRGQEHTVRVPIPSDDITTEKWPSVLENFSEMHDQQYTFRLDNPVEIVNYRVTGVSSVPKPTLVEVGPKGEASGARKGTRRINFGLRGEHDVVVYNRDLLGSDAVIEGPAAIEETATTTIVPPGQMVTVDRLGNLIIERQN